VSYKVTLTIDELEQITPRGAAEGAYMAILLNFLQGSCGFEVTDDATGKVETIELGSDLDDDESMLRHMAVMMVAGKFLSEDQKRELQRWERENLDGHNTSTSDWPGWDAIIGKKPKRFRYDVGLE